MQALIHLRRATVPKIFLTATLVPEHQRVLADAVGISLARTLVLRSPTARPNHRLQMASIPHTRKPSSVCLQLASLLMKTWDDDRAVRGIIFVRSLKKLDQLSTSSPFPVCTYHGQMSDQEKDAQLGSWLSDTSPERWMVSTTALLHGVDYPRVDAVIFSETPFGLYDFVQGAGRAGRSGQESFVAVIYRNPPSIMPDESQYGCAAEMRAVLTTPACRRASISKVMDGEELPCSRVPNSLLCDFCEGQINPLIMEAIESPSKSIPVQENTANRDFVPQPPPGPPPAALLTGFTAQARTKSRKEHADSVKDLMERFSGCFSCRINSDDHGPCHEECGNSGISGCSIHSHRPFECTNFSYKRGWIDWKRQSFSWPRDVKRCFFCGFPSHTVDYAHKGTPGEFPGICRYSDTALTAAWHVVNSPQLFEKLQKDFGFVPGQDVKGSFGTWLTQYGSDSEEVRILSVFSWLCRQYFNCS